jgi:histidinol dehydrogenase
MKRYVLATVSDGERATLLRRSSQQVFDIHLARDVAAIVEDVQVRGDAAVLEATSHFDGISLDRDRLAVSPEEFAAAESRLAPDLVAAIDEAIAHVRAFNRRIVDAASWRAEIAPGIWAGEQASPLDRIGLYVPCRKGSFPSVMIHLGTPAVVAGVRQIAVVMPPLPGGDGAVDPATLVAAARLGIAPTVWRASRRWHWAPSLSAECGASTAPAVRRWPPRSSRCSGLVWWWACSMVPPRR